MMAIENISIEFLQERAVTLLDNGLAVLMGAAGAWMFGFLKNDV